MDCEKYESFIMQHFEKTIQPADAQKLAKHVLACEGCRDLYLAMDIANEGVVSEAPEGFTEAVMVKIREEDVYSQGMTLRVVWGLCALLLGVGLLLFPEGVLSAFYSFVEVINTGAENTAQLGHSLSAEFFGITALLFVAVMGTLLYVLHSGEKART
jgi:hypothetical protein